MIIKLINNKSEPALRLKQRPCMHATAPLILSLCIAESDCINCLKIKTLIRIQKNKQQIGLTNVYDLNQL